jgi:hypothetical protein
VSALSLRQERGQVHLVGRSVRADGAVGAGQADFDWVIAFSCVDTDCPSAAPFVGAHKAAFLVEYGDETRAAAVCPKARSLGLSAILKRDANLDAFRIGCP